MTMSTSSRPSLSGRVAGCSLRGLRAILVLVPALVASASSLSFVLGLSTGRAGWRPARPDASTISLQAAKKSKAAAKKASKGSPVLDGDTVFLRGRLGNFLNAEHSVDHVKSRAPIKADRATWIIEKPGGGKISPNDVVHLRGFQGGYIDVQGDAVRMKYGDRLRYKGLVLTKGIDPKTGERDTSPVEYGDSIYLRANGERHTYLDVEGQDVRARWDDEGEWQVMTIEQPGE